MQEQKGMQARTADSTRSAPGAGGRVARRAIGADDQAPAMARALFRGLLTDCAPELRGRANQIVTELVTNSVQHAKGREIVVEAWENGTGGVDITVTDEGEGFNVPPRAAGHDDLSGWGLLFVDMLSEAWGAGGPGVPRVWAHLEPRRILEEAEAPPPEMYRVLDERIRDLLDVRMVLDSVKDHAIFALDTRGRVTLWNAGAERLTGYRAAEIIGSQLSELHADPAPAGEDSLTAALAHGRQEEERWLVRKDGSRFWADAVVTPMFDSAGMLRGFAAVMQDITWRKRLDDDRVELIARVRELARTDELTGLPNRRRWQEELDRELARARRQRTTLCVAMVDVDGFKRFNDAHGHQAGDKLLQETSRRWSDALRTTDMLARYGGDEFSVLLPDCPLDEAVTVIERLRLATPDGSTCSAGVARGDGSETADGLLRQADVALYEAKRRGRNTTVESGG
jgi:diguanylate cyclase (GGDEF)-like protein/PAS domain S-box-containing protein